MNNSNIIKGILIGIAVLALITLIAIGLLGGFEEFQVYSCGSGFYFNRSAAITYKIKELGITSEENYFILDDYFVSNEYGTEYKIKGNIFNVGSVYLAKKSEYYNPEIYRFNLDTYNSEILTITPEMSYVEIYSSDPNKEHTLMVNVEKRDFPVDITLENVNIVSGGAVPVLFCSSITDINIILKGQNTLRAGKNSYTLQEFIEKVQSGALSFVEQQFYEDVKHVYDELKFLQSTIDGNETFGDVSWHYAEQIFDAQLSFMENAFDAVVGVVTGVSGDQGATGATCVLVPMGISFNGNGTVTIIGGEGAKGGNASNSLIGKASGGKGGNGGVALSCNNIIISADTTVEANGGKGGYGGEPSKGGLGLLGSSGSKGAKGSDGESYIIVNRRRAY